MKQLIKKLLREHTIRSLKVKVDRLFGKNSKKPHQEILSFLAIPFFIIAESESMVIIIV